jgi:hypothetical protein
VAKGLIMNDLNKINDLYNKIPYSNLEFDCFEFLEKNLKEHYKNIYHQKDKENNYNDYEKMVEDRSSIFSKIQDNSYQKGLKTHNINGLLIPFNPEWSRVAINLSGGADSALLTYILATIIESNNYNSTIDIINYKRCWDNKPWQEDVADNVYKWLKNRFPGIIGKKESAYIPPELEHGTIGDIIEGRSADQILVASFNRYIAFKNKYYACFNATTKNPSSDDITSGMTNRDNVPYLIKKLCFVRTDSAHWVIEPFTLVEKDWIIEQYKNLDIMELFNTTRSCEGDADDFKPLGMDHMWYSYVNDRNIEECGKCFWCLERNWAKEKAGIE